jgi:HD superfamily phosphohydrolase
LSNSKPSKKSVEPFDAEVSAWLEAIKKLYEKDDKIDQFNKEENCLTLYLNKLKEEMLPSGRLSICKLEVPYRKGGTAILLKGSHTRIHNQGLMLKFNRPREEGDTRALVETEYNVLPLMEHSNIIQAIDVGEFDISPSTERCPRLHFILEPFIPQAKDLREYATSLSYFGKPVTQTLLDEALHSLIKVLCQWVDALKYVHETRKYVYLDVKPDNAIVGKDGHLVMIDFGTAMKIAEGKDKEDPTPTLIFFSEPYAHPRIKEHYEPTSTNRVTNRVKRKDITPELDYYALGKSILELLETISYGHPHDFPQRPLFQSLHFLATRLLDGQNKKLYSRSVVLLEEKAKLDEVFDGLYPQDYKTIKYENLRDVIIDLNKELGSWDPEIYVPELQTFPPQTLKVAQNINTAFTDRVQKLIEHPLLGRLKTVSQLGLVSLIYPTADYSRYDHVIGSYTYTRYYINALFNDSQNCMFRNLVKEEDIKEALLASLLHDLGQYPLAHDLQDVQDKIFDHSNISIDLLVDDMKDKEGRTLRDIVENEDYGWGAKVERVKRILQAHSSQVRLLNVQTVQDFKADMLSALIDGPIDADKADYIIRDSTECRVPYGQQLDIDRLLSVLTTVRIPDEWHTPHRVTIGIYEKGLASASAFSLARYLMFASVYWHHASRILKTMLQYAAAMILPSEALQGEEGKVKEIRAKLVQFIISCLVPPNDQLPQETPPRVSTEKTKQVIAEEPEEDVLASLEKCEPEKCTDWFPGTSRTDWQMLNWLKQLCTSKQGNLGVALINHIQKRDLYKRVHTIHYNHSLQADTAILIEKLGKLTWLQKIDLCKKLQKIIASDLLPSGAQRVSTKLHPPEEVVQKIMHSELAILVDIPDYKIFLPRRPLIYVPELESKTYYRTTPAKSYDLGEAVDYLMKSISPIRVLCHPDIRQWIGACISPEEMELAIGSALAR